jgi:hypothetical protein
MVLFTTTTPPSLPTHLVDGHVDVCQRVAFDGDQVGKTAGCDCAEFFLFAQ